VLEQLPPPPVVEAKGVEPEYVQALVDAAVSKMLADLPEPKDGESVHPDTVALMVRDAVSQAVEKAVAAMPKPRDGRDALDLEIIEAIEAGKSYAAGTFALHDGGMMLAVRDTDPIETASIPEAAGWKVTQDGIKAVAAELVDPRTYRITIERTSGKVDVKEFEPPCINIDKGVHRRGMKYRAGDGVTFDGSFWIAQRDTDQTPPQDWRLAVKSRTRDR
jgi:hypothetical protein